MATIAFVAICIVISTHYPSIFSCFSLLLYFPVSFLRIPDFSPVTVYLIFSYSLTTLSRLLQRYPAREVVFASPSFSLTPMAKLVSQEGYRYICNQENGTQQPFLHLPYTCISVSLFLFSISPYYVWCP